MLLNYLSMILRNSVDTFFFKYTFNVSSDDLIGFIKQLVKYFDETFHWIIKNVFILHIETKTF